MRKNNVSSGVSVPYYGVAVLWIILSILRQTNRVILSMALSIGIFVLLRIIRRQNKSSSSPNIPIGEPFCEPNENPHQEIRKVTASIQSLKQVTARIQSAKVRENILELETLSRKILNEVEECPEKASQIKTFVEYYFPTTLNILNAYRRAEAAGIEGENINRTKQHIETTLDSSIIVVFRRQLDSLFGADALDISAELAVLQKMMMREGIVGEKFEIAANQNVDGTDIRLRL